MLIKYSVENFRSIRERAILSLEKRNSIKDFESNAFTPDADRVSDLLKSIVIYGYNGSGKSNFLRSASEMRNYILLGHQFTHRDPIPFEPFLLDFTASNNPTIFEIEFIHLGIRYNYTFSTTHERVLNERLIAYPKGTKQTWFDRKFSTITKEYEWSFSGSFKGEKESIKNRTLENVLFLSKAANESHDQVKPLIDFFKDRFYISSNSKSESQTLELLDSETGKKQVLALLHELGLGIDGLTVDSHEITDDEIPSFLPEEIKQQIKQDRPREYDIKSVHRIPGSDKTILFDFDAHESLGTIKVFRLAGLIIKTLDRGSILFIDELEKNLHCKLVSYLVNLFNNPRWNPKNAQLIFTTHSPTILDTNDIRRDQIWFTDKTTDKATILYSVLDVPKQKGAKALRKQHKLSRLVLEGTFYRPPILDGRQFNLFGDND